VNDLRRLLEMYQRWQQRIFPHCPFDDFIQKLEKLSSCHMIKVRLAGACLVPAWYLSGDCLVTAW
jgi:hypothetical protein